MTMYRKLQKSEPVTSPQNALGAVGMAGLVGAIIFWYQYFITLMPSQTIMVVSLTLFFGFVPPAMWAFLLPTSPGAMMLMRIGSKTWGFAAIAAIGFSFALISGYLIYVWFLAQTAVEQSGIAGWLTIAVLFGTIFIPALVWSPVSSSAVVEQAKQAHLVEKYKLMRDAEIAILKRELLRSQLLVAKGLANLTASEKSELHGYIVNLVQGIDNTLYEVGDIVGSITGTVQQFDHIEGNDQITATLNYIQDMLLPAPEPEFDAQEDLERRLMQAPAAKRGAR